MPEKIAILGGTGQMGKWFEDFFTRAGHDVIISGRKTGPSYEEIADSCKVVILSMPLLPAMNAAKTIGPMLSPDQALMDILSLKEEIAKAMHEATRAEVVATHPLFGPNTNSMEGQNVILCPMRGEFWANWFEKEITAAKGKVTRCPPSTHDQNMALVQGLTHFITICLGKTLEKMNKTPEELLAFATPIFRLKLDLVGRLFAQDLALFTDLISENPRVIPVLDGFLQTAQETGQAFCNGEPQNGKALLEKLRDFLGDFPEQGMAESNAALSSIFEYKKS